MSIPSQNFEQMSAPKKITANTEFAESFDIF